MSHFKKKYCDLVPITLVKICLEKRKNFGHWVSDIFLITFIHVLSLAGMANLPATIQSFRSDSPCTTLRERDCELTADVDNIYIVCLLTSITPRDIISILPNSAIFNCHQTFCLCVHCVKLFWNLNCYITYL